jgi:hypothetical protein
MNPTISDFKDLQYANKAIELMILHCDEIFGKDCDYISKLFPSLEKSNEKQSSENESSSSEKQSSSTEKQPSEKNTEVQSSSTDQQSFEKPSEMKKQEDA